MGVLMPLRGVRAGPTALVHTHAWSYLNRCESVERRTHCAYCTGLVSMGVRGCLVAADARVRPTGACASVCGVAPPARQRRVNPSYLILHRVNERVSLSYRKTKSVKGGTHSARRAAPGRL